MMILAGEAIGKWAMRETKSIEDDGISNSLKLPFRSQEKPDYRSRERERKIMMDLLDNNIGDGYCHAWYSRRFLTPAKVSTDANPHSGLGLSCYVQWTSPIRRFQDLQAHATVKRFLRRQKVFDLLENGQEIPPGITSEALGCELPSLNKEGKIELDTEDIDKDIDYSDRTNLLRPVQFVQRNSNKFWMLEYIRRIKEADPQRTLEVLVLGCINPSKLQYAVFIFELGLEWRYNSPVGIQAGDRFKARLGNVLPQNGQMTIVRVPNG
jgi:exoribonuclease R